MEGWALGWADRGAKTPTSRKSRDVGHPSSYLTRCFSPAGGFGGGLSASVKTRPVAAAGLLVPSSDESVTTRSIGSLWPR